MSKFKEYEGVVCKNKAEMRELADIAKEKGYRLGWALVNRPKYKNLIFWEGEFYDAADWAIKYPITREEFINKL